MAFLVNKPVTRAGLGAMAARRNNHLHAPVPDGLDERIAVIAPVADKGLVACRGVNASNVSACPMSLACPPVSTNSSGFPKASVRV